MPGSADPDGEAPVISKCSSDKQRHKMCAYTHHHHENCACIVREIKRKLLEPQHPKPCPVCGHASNQVLLPGGQHARAADRPHNLLMIDDDAGDTTGGEAAGPTIAVCHC